MIIIKKTILFFMLILLVGSLGVKAETVDEEVIEGDSVKRRTVREVENLIFERGFGAGEEIKLKFHYVHPEYEVDYGVPLSSFLEEEKKKTIPQVEKELKEDYFLVLVSFSVEWKKPGLMFYEIKNSFKLKNNGQEYDCIDFYDIARDISVGAEYKNGHYRGKLYEYIVYGYLMFDKIDPQDEVVLKSDYFNEEIQVEWNVNEVNELFEVLK